MKNNKKRKKKNKRKRKRKICEKSRRSGIATKKESKLKRTNNDEKCERAKKTDENSWSNRRFFFFFLLSFRGTLFPFSFHFAFFYYYFLLDFFLLFPCLYILAIVEIEMHTKNEWKRTEWIIKRKIWRINSQVTVGVSSCNSNVRKKGKRNGKKKIEK